MKISGIFHTKHIIIIIQYLDSKYHTELYSDVRFDAINWFLGPPDPPNNVIVWCKDKERIAEIEWHPGKENYAPILNFIIQFNTTFSSDTWIDIATNVSQNERKRVISLSPYGNYTFRVLARNKIGLSPPSLHTRNVCRTEEDVPDKNPENVIGEGDEPHNLVIYWTVRVFSLGSAYS